MDRYDVVIIGGGQAGVPLAHALAARGQRVALAERKQLGGSCVNFGCTPTKAGIASARLAHDARQASRFGLRIPSVEVDYAAVLARAAAIAADSRRALEADFESANPRLLRGHARFAGRDGDHFAVQVGGQDVHARQVVLDTGTRTRVPEVPGLREVEFLHAGNWLDHPVLPERLVVLGGGVIALEMSQFYRRMGSSVTVLERSERVAGREDTDVADAIRGALEGEGVEIRPRTTTESVARRPHGLEVAVRSADRAERLAATHIFLATGRRPNTDDLGLETIGLEPGRDGILEADERLASRVAGVWVAGDIRGGPQFTHTSWDDHRILLDQLAGERRRTTRRIVPYAIFTDPELGRVGVTETEARAAGSDHEVLRFDMWKSGRARESGADAGFIKVVVERTTRKILGAAVLADRGAELVHLYVDLMNAGAPATVIRDAVHIHPTLAEAVQSAVS
jgi:pyruvate/2-oxoglutarate dehydrogenase complex dihydrolipoamide dehydrogenase (E3) component